MVLTKKTVLNVLAIIIGLILVLGAYYWANSLIYIDTQSIKSMDGGLGHNGEDMSYTWRQLPSGVFVGDTVKINFNNGEVNYHTSCKINTHQGGGSYYCQATWPMDNFSQIGEEPEYGLKDAYNKDHYTLKTRTPVTRFFRFIPGSTGMQLYMYTVSGLILFFIYLWLRMSYKKYKETKRKGLFIFEIIIANLALLFVALVAYLYFIFEAFGGF